jgi:hypothetical protein
MVAFKLWQSPPLVKNPIFFTPASLSAQICNEQIRTKKTTALCQYNTVTKQLQVFLFPYQERIL